MGFRRTLFNKRQEFRNELFGTQLAKNLPTMSVDEQRFFILRFSSRRAALKPIAEEILRWMALRMSMERGSLNKVDLVIASDFVNEMERYEYPTNEVREEIERQRNMLRI